MPQPNMQQILKQAQKMQQDMLAAQEALKDEVVEASAGGGMVTVKVSGDLVVKSIAIDAEVYLFAACSGRRNVGGVIVKPSRGMRGSTTSTCDRSTACGDRTGAHAGRMPTGSRRRLYAHHAERHARGRAAPAHREGSAAGVGSNLMPHSREVQYARRTALVETIGFADIKKSEAAPHPGPSSSVRRRGWLARHDHGSHPVTGARRMDSGAPTRARLLSSERCRRDGPARGR